LGAALVLLAAAAMASELASTHDRIARLENALLAPCCWSEAVAVHRSPVALEIRSEIASFVRQGKTDREILDYYKAKYGVRILTDPEGAARVMVDVVPWAAAVLGALGVALVIRRMARRNPELEMATGSELPDVADDDW
jgi:cytochrome c-type biogenesis protein CcmH